MRSRRKKEMKDDSKPYLVPEKTGDENIHGGGTSTGK